MVTQEQQAKLADEWSRLMRALNVPSDLHWRAFAQIVTAYSEPHRHYHTLDHIVWMLHQLFIEVKYSTPFPEPEWKMLELATWYHDVVYDPRSEENESRSAEVARNSLYELGLSEDRIARVCELILMTKDHQAPAADTNALLFLDLDLSILGANVEPYDEYAWNIRREYAWVPERDYCLGRRKVLQKFLERPAVFRSDWFRHLESKARANITAEIAQIGEILRTLPP